MLLEKTRMREMMLKARMTFSTMNTSRTEGQPLGFQPSADSVGTHKLVGEAWWGKGSGDEKDIRQGIASGRGTSGNEGRG